MFGIIIFRLLQYNLYLSLYNCVKSLHVGFSTSTINYYHLFTIQNRFLHTSINIYIPVYVISSSITWINSNICLKLMSSVGLDGSCGATTEPSSVDNRNTLRRLLWLDLDVFWLRVAEAFESSVFDSSEFSCLPRFFGSLFSFLKTIVFESSVLESSLCCCFPRFFTSFLCFELEEVPFFYCSSS